MLRAVERTFRILFALSASGTTGKRLGELARQLGLSDATLLRFLQSLQEVGAVNEKDGVYRLTDLLVRLGAAKVIDLRTAAEPVLRRLSEELKEDVHLATLDADAALCLESLKSSHVLGVTFGTGFRVPIYASAMGKAILAFMDAGQRAAVLRRVELQALTPRTITDPQRLEEELAETRRRGYALDAGELEPGVHCVAVPIMGPGGRVVGSVSVTAPAARRSLQDLAACAPVVLAVGAEVSRRLQAPGDSFEQSGRLTAGALHGRATMPG